MNARAQTKDNSKHAEFLKKINFRPVFDEDGNIFDIRELEVSTDRRDGITAMRNLFETSEAGDNILGADGWTGKQRRILSSPAPLEAHYLRYSEKWDARTGMMREAALIQLPFEVVWTLFELVFEGQYSFEVIDIFNEDEEVVPVGVDHQGEQADDAPGRRFFARATVALHLHLPGQAAPRTYHGVGVSYGQLRTEKTGNIYAINSERRTVDKGAVADAKREALSSMGRVFRRAFEDGDDMLKQVETLLLGRIQDMNRPAIHQRPRKSETVPAPVRKSSSPAPQAAEKATEQNPAVADKAPVDTSNKQESTAKVASPAVKDKPKSEIKPDQKGKPQDGKVKVTVPGAPARTINREGFTEAFIDILFETCVTGTEAQKLLNENEAVILEHAKDRSEIDAVVKSMTEQPEDEIPDFSVPSQAAEAQPDEVAVAAEDLRINVSGKSGKDVLAELQGLCEKCKNGAEINAIIAANPEALRKLTPKQMGRFTEVRADLEAKLKT